MKAARRGLPPFGAPVRMIFTIDKRPDRRLDFGMFISNVT
jgi:hypothetical protein